MSEPNELNIEGQKNSAQKTGFFTVLPAELLSTATRTSGQFTNPYANGLILTVVVANEAGTCSFTPKLQTVNGYGTAFVWWTAAAAITANGTYQYLIYPVSITNSAFTEVVTFPVPSTWQLVLTYAGTPASDKMDTKASASYI